MAKVTDVHNPEAVNRYIEQIAEPLKPLVDAIRRVVLAASPDIGQHIKWNAPAFFYTGHMAAFNAKEYKRDILVFNLRQKDHILLIFPTGAKVFSPILEGDYDDGRRMVKIYNMEDLEAKQFAIQQIINDWLALIDN